MKKRLSSPKKLLVWVILHCFLKDFLLYNIGLTPVDINTDNQPFGPQKISTEQLLS